MAFISGYDLEIKFNLRAFLENSVASISEEVYYKLKFIE